MWSFKARAKKKARKMASAGVYRGTRQVGGGPVQRLSKLVI